MDRTKVVSMAEERNRRYLDMTQGELERAELEASRPSKNAWRLSAHERELIARALVEYAATIPREWALAYPRWMYEIAGKLDITERLRAYAKSLDERDAAKVTEANKRQ